MICAVSGHPINKSFLSGQVQRVFLGAYLCEHGTVHSPQGDVDGRHARVSLCFLHEQVCEAVVTELHQRRAYVCRYSSA
ncbi:TPA: hypothetical protein ACH3X2_002553 [Trebouxia sp. C0005]